MNNLYLLTLLYVALVIMFGISKDLFSKGAGEFGDFLAGTFAPLAFFWLIVGYINQAREIKMNSKALEQNAEAIKIQAEQLRQFIIIEKQQQLKEAFPILYFQPEFGGFDSTDVYSDAFGFTITNFGAHCQPRSAIVKLASRSQWTPLPWPNQGRSDQTLTNNILYGYSIRRNLVEGAGKGLLNLGCGHIWFLPNGRGSGHSEIEQAYFCGEVELGIQIKANIVVYVYVEFEMEITNRSITRYEDSWPVTLSFRRPGFTSVVREPLETLRN